VRITGVAPAAVPSPRSLEASKPEGMWQQAVRWLPVWAPSLGSGSELCS